MSEITKNKEPGIIVQTASVLCVYSKKIQDKVFHVVETVDYDTKSMVSFLITPGIEHSLNSPSPGQKRLLKKMSDTLFTFYGYPTTEDISLLPHTVSKFQAVSLKVTELPTLSEINAVKRPGMDVKEARIAAGLKRTETSLRSTGGIEENASPRRIVASQVKGDQAAFFKSDADASFSMLTDFIGLSPADVTSVIKHLSQERPYRGQEIKGIGKVLSVTDTDEYAAVILSR
jgi:hypothetical protein